MRRSFCYTEPSLARAGQIFTWQFHYTSGQSLPKGSKIKFDLLTQGRPVDWETPSVDLKRNNNVIYLTFGENIIVPGKVSRSPNSSSPTFEFTLPSSLEAGEDLIIVMGAAPDTDPLQNGNGAQLFVQRRKQFQLSIDSKGKGNYDPPEIFSIDIRGNVLNIIKVLAPSCVSKNKRFDITVRFEDEFGNLTGLAPEGTLIDLSYEHLRENLNWRLFVPETGFVTLPNLYFNETGLYRIQLKNIKTDEIFVSAPLKCFAENTHNLLWGQLRGKSERPESDDSIEGCLRHFRDEKAFNFFAPSPLDSAEDTTNEAWKAIQQNINDFNEEERFITLPGMQYKGDAGKEGLRQIVYMKEGKPILRKKDPKSSSLAKIYKNASPKELFSIPILSMAKGHHFDFEEFNSDFERIVEIYGMWGCSENLISEKNPYPIKGPIGEVPEGNIITALKKNKRFGFIAGGFDDRSPFNKMMETDQSVYPPGLCAIFCSKYNRESLAEALYNRHCYATTGQRILVGFFVTGAPMGSELSTEIKPGLHVNRHISGYVAGTSTILSIQIIRNGELLHAFTPNSNNFDFEYDDMVPLKSITLNPEKDEDAPFVFYYLRVIQEDGMAWSSPIWVDVPVSTAPTIEQTPKA
ncbi:DUF3604 domain-containing protein [Candidatus Clavichlamydia salmonicola]|uniref:DUF3604 domain-containing protein n=1 Tax=Candidatus Clavichlamydia salmonicola TaxID=469812 RepID=UPI001891E35C|nr:DUF3604 domain-containing protein [Candidatus Clavichlamydia salmonicola]